MKKIYIQPRIETVATTPQQILCTSGGIRAEISGYGKSSGGFTQMPVWLAGIICSSLLFLGTACSSNNPDQPKQQAELKPRTLIVQTSPQPSPQERGIQRLPQATITENEGVLDALWNAGDAVFYRNLSRDAYTDPQEGPVDLFGTLNADKDGSVASFSGDRVWCTEDDQLALIYPVPNPSAFTFHDNPLTAEYTISIAGQDGTLATLAKDFHHIYGIASVVSVTGTTANAELAQMKSLMTVCKFSFVDESDNQLPITLLPISTLSISVSDGYYGGTYPQQGTVSIAQSTPAWDVSVDPERKASGNGGEPLTITPEGNPKEVYVALFPDMETTYKFTVTSGGNTYTGTAKAVLNAGEFVPATGLKLVKQP